MKTRNITAAIALAAALVITPAIALVTIDGNAETYSQINETVQLNMVHKMTPLADCSGAKTNTCTKNIYTCTDGGHHHLADCSGVENAQKNYERAEEKLDTELCGK